MLAILLMIASGLLLYWLYLEAIEREKGRLMDLAILHVHQLEAISEITDKGDLRTGDQLPKADRMKNIFDAQPTYHRFGETGEIVFVQVENIPVSANVSRQRETKLLPDAHGRKYLTAYAPFIGTSFGVAARVDLQEIQLPYLQSGIGIGLLELLAMLLGGMFIFYRKDSSPKIWTIMK